MKQNILQKHAINPEKRSRAKTPRRKKNKKQAAEYSFRVKPDSVLFAVLRLAFLCVLASWRDHQSCILETQNPFSLRQNGFELALAGMFKVPRKLMSNRH